MRYSQKIEKLASIYNNLKLKEQPFTKENLYYTNRNPKKMKPSNYAYYNLVSCNVG